MASRKTIQPTTPRQEARAARDGQVLMEQGVAISGSATLLRINQTTGFRYARRTALGLQRLLRPSSPDQTRAR